MESYVRALWCEDGEWGMSRMLRTLAQRRSGRERVACYRFPGFNGWWVQGKNVSDFVGSLVVDCYVTVSVLLCFPLHCDASY